MLDIQAVLEWLLAHPDLTVTVATAVGGTLAGARQYQRTGRLPLSSLPWRALRRLGYHTRRRFFATSRPPAESTSVIQASVDDVQTTLGRQSYEPGWPLSYYYQGEDLNARRYYYAPGREYPHRQLHIRAWSNPSTDTVDVDAHDEPSPLQHP
ncbi:hypothetical protein, partial [Haloarchaeobius sp. HRN-SO-5]|uniref:hypothetical protein n=1 Tax=Haloarchaeobius sp. HRN-SO-5 TaxID=3446118 RepID=UPI003EB82CD2